MADGEKPGVVDSRDERKHSGRNDLLFRSCDNELSAGNCARLGTEHQCVPQY